MITDATKNGRLEGTYKIDFSRMHERDPPPCTVASIQISPFGTVYAAGPQTTLGVADFEVDFSIQLPCQIHARE